MDRNIGLQTYLPALLILLLLPAGVHAAATIADIYAAASEADRLYVPTPTYCYTGSNLINCTSDANFTSRTDVYTVVGDGATTTGFFVQDKGNTQTAVAKLTYDTDGLFPGTYYLRFALSANTDSFDYVVCAYQNATDINQSACVYLYHPPNDDRWVEGDIDDVVRASVAVFNGRVVLRMWLVDGPTTADSITITEVYLKRPIKQEDFSVVAQGVAEAEIDTWIENTWNIVSVAALPAVTNYSCEIYRLNNINTTKETLLNVTNIYYNVSAELGFFKVYWEADDNVTSLEEGYNYEVACTGYLGALSMEFSQFVYINRQRTIFTHLDALVLWILQLLGIAQDTQQLVSGEVFTPDLTIYVGQVSYLTSFVNYADGAINDANCYASVWYPNSSLWVDEQLMNATGSDGRYTYELVPYYEGSYAARVSCNGTSLMNRTRYASSLLYARVDIFEGTPKLELLSQDFIAGEEAQLVAQLLVGSNVVTNAQCEVSAFDNNLALLDTQNMSYSSSGFYNYSWIIPITRVGNYIVKIVCSGGSLGTVVAQHSAAVHVGKPTGQLWVGGTEYPSYEATGRVVARIVDNAGDPVNNASCNLVVFLPENVSVYINDTMSVPVGQLNGVYYYDFNQSGEIGVHAYVIDCEKNSINYLLLGAYHVYYAPYAYMGVIS